MVPELTAAWQLNALGLSSLLGLYFFTYAGFALVAGASLDRYGAKWTIPAGIACLAVGIAMFGWGTVLQAEIGRLLQGAGSAFSFPGRYLATAVGATQMFGILGGFAGQFVVSPMVHGVITWQDFWLYSGAIVAVLAAVTRNVETVSRIRGVLSQGKIKNPEAYERANYIKILQGYDARTS